MKESNSGLNNYLKEIAGTSDRALGVSSEMAGV